MFEKKQTGAAPSDDKDKESIPEQKEGKEERKRGGKMPEAFKERDEEEEEHEKKKEHHHARKRGGKVPGEKSKHRPDRRARGGGADMHPESSGGNMSTMDYEKGHRTNVDEDGAGAGPDRNAKGFS